VSSPGESIHRHLHPGFCHVSQVHVCRIQDRAFRVQDSLPAGAKPCCPVPWRTHKSSSTRVRAVARQGTLHPPVYPSRTDYPLLIACSGLESLALWIPPQSNAADFINPLSSLLLSSPSFSRPSNLQSTGNPSDRTMLSLLTNLTNTWTQCD
jgi:hypothetical protein